MPVCCFVFVLVFCFSCGIYLMIWAFRFFVRFLFEFWWFGGFLGFLERGGGPHRARKTTKPKTHNLQPKLHQNPPQNQSTSTQKWSPGGHLGHFGPNLRSREFPNVTFLHIWDHFGHPWGPLGTHLAPLWSTLGAQGSHFGALWAPCGTIWVTWGH